MGKEKYTTPELTDHDGEGEQHCFEPHCGDGVLGDGVPEPRRLRRVLRRKKERAGVSKERRTRMCETRDGAFIF